MNFSLEKKILVGFCTCALVLVVVALVSLHNGERFVETNQWVNHTQKVLYQFEQILVSVVDVETGARGFVITGDDHYLTPFINGKRKVFEYLQAAEESTSDNADQQKNIQLLKSKIQLRFVPLEEAIALRRTSGFDVARTRVTQGDGQRLQEEIRTILQRSHDIEDSLLAQRRETSNTDIGDFNRMFILLLVLIILVLVMVYFLIMANLKALRRAEAETANKNWTLAGSDELIRNMQGNKSLKELSQAIIDYLVTYVQAQIGAFYVVRDNNTELQMTSAYAADIHVEEIRFVSFGVGLAGQAAVVNEILLVDDIAEEHFYIKTGFGKIMPKTIICVPFAIDGRVIGVIEMGALKPFTILQQEYLSIVMSNIAIAVVSAQAREKTKVLLEETQLQAEELVAQQEELRQSNDELHAKTELLEKSEWELKLQQEELTKNNEELEVKANMLIEQKEKLETANVDIEAKANEIEITSKYKSEFLANMSHELRTPLNSILVLAQLLSENKNKTLVGKEVEFAKNIYNSGNDLLNLINEILDLSKIEAGKMELDVEEVSFEQITTSITSMFSELAKTKNIEFVIDPIQNLPVGFISDRQRVEQVLRNLLANAFKFTPQGGSVYLKIKKSPASLSFKDRAVTDIDVVAFEVIDTGIGIPKDKQLLIFQAFQQADGSTKRKYGGTGLGLSISKELAFALGGEIHLESEEGKGSSFTLLLPLQGATSMQHQSSDVVKPTDIHDIKDGSRFALPVFDDRDDRTTITDKDSIILIIEDDRVFADLLLTLVHERKFKGILAHNGNSGISYARLYKPDAILLDMKLPLIDGIDVLRKIKHDPELRHIPVLIISAFDHRKEGLHLGAFAYIQKPADAAELNVAFDDIQTFINKQQKKLLIVEDNEIQNMAIKELIGNGDVVCSSAYKGSEAYDMLERNDFDCIIVDLGLPDMSGFTLLEKIRANIRLNKIPVIVYTGKDLERDETIRLNSLADTVVLKTVASQERLLDEAMLFLHRKESRLPKEKQSMIRKVNHFDEALRDRTILLVDDDIRNIYSLTNALEEEGLRCITAENGKIALQQLHANPDVDLVLMDIMMPEMDGYETTFEIRKDIRYANLPIIALTAKAMKGDREKCLAVGMSDYVSKPVDIQHLLSRMRVWLYR